MDNGIAQKDDPCKYSETDQTISEAKVWLESFEHGRVEYVLTLAFLAHAYSYRMYLHYGRTDTEQTCRSLIPALSYLGVIEDIVSAQRRPVDLGLILETRLRFNVYHGWIKEDFDNYRLSDHSPNSQQLVDRAAEDKRALRQEYRLRGKPDRFDLDGTMIHHLIYKRLNPRYVLVDDPTLDWWQSNIDDRSIDLLKSIRVGSGSWSRHIQFWRFEVLLRQIIQAYKADNDYAFFFKQLLRRRGSLSRPSVTGSEFKKQISYWAEHRQETVEYRGLRVYKAAFVLCRPWLDAIINTPDLSPADKIKLVWRLDPYSCSINHRLKNLKAENPNIGFPAIPASACLNL